MPGDIKAVVAGPGDASVAGAGSARCGWASGTRRRSGSDGGGGVAGGGGGEWPVELGNGRWSVRVEVERGECWPAGERKRVEAVLVELGAGAAEAGGEARVR